MKYIERYIKKLSDDIVINESKVKNSKSKYYILNKEFKIRLSDHLSPLPTKMQKCNLNIIQDFLNPELFVVTLNMHPMPITMDRKQIKQYIDVLFTQFKLQTHFNKLQEELSEDANNPDNTLLSDITFNKELKIIKRESSLLKLKDVTNNNLMHYCKVINNIRSGNQPTTKQLGKAVSEILSIEEFSINKDLHDIQPYINQLHGLEFQDYIEEGMNALYETFYESHYPNMHSMIKFIGTMILAEYLKNKNPNAHFPKSRSTVYTALQQLCEIHKDIKKYIEF